MEGNHVSGVTKVGTSEAKKKTATRELGSFGEEAKQGKERVGGVCELVDYDDLPEYMKENEFIRRYYRAEWPLKHALFSLFRVHNETLNVWTHLIGFFIFLWLTALHLRDVPLRADILHGFNLNWPVAIGAAENVSKDTWSIYGMQTVATFIRLSAAPTESCPMRSSGGAEAPLLPGGGGGGGGGGEGGRVEDNDQDMVPRWPLMTFMCGSMFCLLCSSVCHLFCCHSHRFNLFLWRMDYVGIATMIVTSFYPPIYYVFLCQPHWQLVYLSAISAMGVATAITLFAPQFSTPRFRVYRALLFLAMGFSGLVPAIHATIVNWDEPQRPITLAYESTMALLYVVGTAFYITRIPERWKPGLFDLTGHSHQLFHAFVVGGALAHYAATLLLLDWRNNTPHACSAKIEPYH